MISVHSSPLSLRRRACPICLRRGCRVLPGMIRENTHHRGIRSRMRGRDSWQVQSLSTHLWCALLGFEPGVCDIRLWSAWYSIRFGCQTRRPKTGRLLVACIPPSVKSDTDLGPACLSMTDAAAVGAPIEGEGLALSTSAP